MTSAGSVDAVLKATIPDSIRDRASLACGFCGVFELEAEAMAEATGTSFAGASFRRFLLDGCRGCYMTALGRESWIIILSSL